MPTMPSLFISHGAPTLALDPGRTGQALTRLAAELPRPRAIVIASAHWPSAEPTVGTAAQPETIHDFGGFPDALYALRYPAAGATDLAPVVAGLLGEAGMAPRIDTGRGLDHGAWVPLRLMYPQADIPVLPLSIQPHRDPAHHLALGRALAPLRDQDVLVIGSGNLTHNLRDALGRTHGDELDYVAPFADWVAQRLTEGDIDALLDYRRQAPHAVRAHPTDEHLLPLFVALGAAGEHASATRIDAGVDLGALAMDIYRFEAA